ncbi:nuclease [Sphingobium sp. WCS2017Hpa-17]|uniref:nuclease n=1 Tax=Sphingobium sp. WCS2017Hpa-17 TaxID=3073638 RepID=UPI00288C6303|nr:nuclease [Sphingobium sp. WCS2017Hpa-17]
MARNLYDVGDRTPDETGSWLNEKQEKRARVVPIGMLFGALALAIGGAIVFGQLLPATDEAGKTTATTTSITDEFALCDDSKGDACVLGADAYAWRGQRYHIADISVPSAIDAHCPQEAERARKGRAALLAMMNGGAFDAVPDAADPNPSARILLRDNVSLGQLMVLKGHAKPWSGKPIDWCKG